MLLLPRPRLQSWCTVRLRSLFAARVRNAAQASASQSSLGVSDSVAAVAVKSGAPSLRPMHLSCTVRTEIVCARRGAYRI
eukprot:3084358-Prymnesium_polylepis.4